MLPQDSFIAAALGGTIGFDTTTSWLQFIVWLAYLGLTLSACLAPAKEVQAPHQRLSLYGAIAPSKTSTGG
jgi:hypothetical protein